MAKENPEQPAPPRHPPMYATLDDVAYETRLAKSTLQRMIAARQFPSADITIGGRIRLWRRETIAAWGKDG